MQKLHFQYVSTDALTVNLRNARTHDRKQIQQIAASIREFGFTNPILVDTDGVLIAGHGRLEAARFLNLETVPVIRVAHLPEPARRALMLADNKIALNAGWNMDLLAAELTDLGDLELGFDIEVTGFEAAEIDIILDAARNDGEDSETAAEPESGTPTTAPGDLWQLGPHRVLCGDARSCEDVLRLMGDERADAGFTDPPYNVRIHGHVGGKGKTRHREFEVASGEMTSDEFAVFLQATLGFGSEFSKAGSVWFVCMDWRHLPEMLTAGRSVFETQLNLCVWAKTNGGMGSLYRSQHELVLVYRAGKGRHRNNVSLGRYGRNRTNIWRYPGVNTFRKGRMDELRAHPTAKPVAMVRDALLDVTKRGDLVLDPFMGAGATLMAAEASGRRAFGLEIDPAYVDVILRRWRDATGEEPVRLSDGRFLSEIEDDRGEGEA
ncbi:site-specific DNA-methyltransferase [Marimonas sp. MJW-29]|uniref:Methyltransferase n=1 Tax=Sulfitobacter sediminis TaxID=3234186 RepID=A0ABV3RU34_9RHOB